MGLCATAKGLTSETGFYCGYITYGNFLKELAISAYGSEMGRIYKEVDFEGRKPTDEEIELWNKNCNDDLDLLLFHSDCDGKFSWKECRKIYNAIKDLHMDMQGHNYGAMKPYNMLEHWKNIFLHCARHRVNLYYS